MNRLLCDWLGGACKESAAVQVHNFMDLAAPWMNLCRDHLLDYLEVTKFVSAKVLTPNPLFVLPDMESA
jgi:hypothetical protein